MKSTKWLVLVLMWLTIAVNAGAEKVYESVDSKGNVEFSDQPGHGSKQINVTPNVVNTPPVPQGEFSTSPSPAPAGPKQSTGGPTAPVITEESGVGTNYDEEQRKQKVRNAEVLHEQRSQKAGQGGVHRK
jgi:hypothetical protein